MLVLKGEIFMTSILKHLLEDKDFSLWSTAATNYDITNDHMEVTDLELKMEFEIPGFEKDEVSINIEEGVLVMNAENDKRHFSRKYKINASFDTESTSAELKNGILTVKIPKVKKSKKDSVNVKIK
jgi:HSP20 family molecular chaperone IbpA